MIAAIVSWMGTGLCVVAVTINVRNWRRVKRSRGEDAERLEQVAALIHHIVETHEPADTELRWHADWIALQAERAHIFAGHRDAEIKRLFGRPRRRHRRSEP